MKFQVYEDKRGETRWRIRARNGNIMGTSGEGYVAEASCYASLYSILKSIGAESVRIEEMDPDVPKMVKHSWLWEKGCVPAERRRGE